MFGISYIYLQNPNGNAIYLPYSSSSQAKGFWYSSLPVCMELSGTQPLHALRSCVFINMTIMEI